MAKKSANTSIVDGLNQAFTNKIRVGIMAVLVVNDWVDFNTLKKLINTSDGNLATHLNNLEKKSYLIYKKDFVGRKPRTSYQCTQEGREAFQKHLQALESLLNSQQIILDKQSNN